MCAAPGGQQEVEAHMVQRSMVAPDARLHRRLRRGPRHQHLATAVLWLAVAGAAACEGASSATRVESYYTDATIPPVGQGGGTGTSGLPCPVADVLAAQCLVCHSNPPMQGVPLSLGSYADLTASSQVDPAVTVAQRAVLRMQDPQSPMPPGAAPSASAADVATIQAWIDAGYPTGECGADGGTNPFDVPPVCSSGSMWLYGEDGGDLMHPGRACIACHLQSGDDGVPIFTIAGTVYPTAHEPNECVSTAAMAATVVITDADLHAVSLGVNASGNFTYYQPGFVAPYTAKVVFEGRERLMSASQTNGDCNGCHTQDGAQGAPGRILLP